jgi:bifunctional UDP-N-acetylglucosamine pyrophosphorylase/glucosamine-1-phosphate N-acetyltransferase
MTAWAAVILAAGKGTRLRSRHPKVLHPLGGAPLGAYPVRRALELGAREVVVVIGHEADRVRAELNARFPDQLTFVEQTEQLGTGHAARVGLAGASAACRRVLILSGDVPLLSAATLRRLLDGDERVRFLTTRLADPTGYGRVVRDAAGRVQRIVEQKDASAEELNVQEVNAGTYFADADFLRARLGELSADNAQGELYLTDVVEAAAREGSAEAVLVDDAVELRGVNTRRELAELQRIQWSRKAEALMAAGVTLLDPDATRIDPDVEVGADTVLHPNVVLRGSSQIGDDCEIGVGCVLDDARIADGVVLHPYTVVESARVDAEATIGPFARLRPGSHLGAGAKVGNFVETKNSRFAPGAKANHLAYVGDADVGANANVGAGTITCNYDGVGKHRTSIGDGVFVGSNSTLVAPVTIGSGAYVAAGSTLTDDVPEGAVAFGRARQINKEGRAEPLREKTRDRKRQSSEGKKS